MGIRRLHDMRLVWVIMLLIGGSAGLSAQQVLAKLEVLPAVDSLDTYLFVRELQLTVGYDEALGVDLNLNWPSWKDTLGGMDLIQAGKREQFSQNGQMIEKQKLIVMTHRAGTYTIPTIKLDYLYKGKQQSRYTDPLTFTVATQALPAQSELKPIAPIWETQPAWWQWLILVGIIAALVAGGIWLARRPKVESAIEAKPKGPQVPPHETAMRLLAGLEGQKLWQNGNIKAYYSEISYILRQYIEETFRIPALESITDDIVRDLKAENISPKRIAELADLLEMADLAKFAKSIPSDQQNLMAMEEARTFVKDTHTVIPQYKQAEQLTASEASTGQGEPIPQPNE